MDSQSVPRVQRLLSALDRLETALARPEDDITRDACIQRFEFTFELAWRAIQRRARAEGLECVSPRACLRVAFSLGLLEDDAQWMSMVEDRIRTPHTYDETTARAVYEALPGHARLLRELGRRLAERVPSISTSSGDRIVPLFDAYVMVDWSGGDSRRCGEDDCIWIAHGARTDEIPATQSPCSRTEAEVAIRSLLEPFAESRENRVLVCADFGYGYPTGFASLLPQSVGITREREPWRVVWEYLRSHMQDDLRTTPGRVPSNRSNRFDVADTINAAASTPGSSGPFWCLFKKGSRASVPQNRPAQPFGGAIEPLRITDRRAKSDTPFRLFGTGSVGSQMLTGIPRFERLRFDPKFSPHSAVWPFETGWAPTSGAWLNPGLRIVHAEIYPSVRAPLSDTIKDRGQVRAMWHWAHRLDAQGLLVNEFMIPLGIESGSPDDVVIRSEEGWILGCPRGVVV
jgi:nucleotidyltransferase substrate binding protein (TIGR01987 family)